MIQLMLVDDHHVVRNGFRLIFESQHDMNVLVDVESGKAALNFLMQPQYQKSNVILTDINMEEIDGIKLIKKVHEEYPTIRMLALSMVDDVHIVSEVLHAGGDGYLLKESSCDEVLFGIRQFVRGEKYISVSLGIACVDGYLACTDRTPDKEFILSAYDISARELTILELIAEGHTNAKIADRIFLSKRTVEGHRQRLIEKTNTKNTAYLVRFGFLHMLLY